MKYQQKEFSSDLLERIKNTEAALKDYMNCLSIKYKPVFAQKKLGFEARFFKECNDPFTPGYISTTSIGIDENESLINLHTIKIWECNRYILGMPTSKNVPGNKIIGEFLDETLEDVKEELTDYINDLLEE